MTANVAIRFRPKGDFLRCDPEDKRAAGRRGVCYWGGGDPLPPHRDRPALSLIFVVNPPHPFVEREYHFAEIEFGPAS